MASYDEQEGGDLVEATVRDPLGAGVRPMDTALTRTWDDRSEADRARSVVLPSHRRYTSGMSVVTSWFGTARRHCS